MENVELEIGLVLIDFYANWCGPCKITEPIIEQCVETHGIKLYKCDVDKHKPFATKYNVRALPTVVILKDGKEVDRLTSVITSKKLNDAIRDAA